ncbi:hypothetical protein R5R35_005162 [Gryllus longicercus]|uniref:HTH CENPB-type domain-containing protein n=1 Tax=Gryllus longicercus TaxID=2509291 RepID=A0AAN9V793_9ORTH
MEENEKDESLQENDSRENDLHNVTLREKNVKCDYPVPKCRGLKPAAGTLERDLWCWYRARASKVPKHVIQLRARWIFKQAGITNFKASDGWFRRWYRRWRKFSKESDNSFQEANDLETCFSNDKEDQQIESISDSVVEQLAPSDEVLTTNSADKIITPSFDDPLETSFPCLEHKRIPAHIGTSSSQEIKDDEKLSTPIHDNFEKYSRTSKTPRLKDCELIKSNCPPDIARRGKVCRRLPEVAGLNGCTTIATRKKKGNKTHKQAEEYNSKERERVRRIGKRYHPQFKERVLAYLKSHTFKETARKFGVHQASISAWQKDKLRCKHAEEGASSGNSVDSSPAPADCQFLSWLRRERGHALTAAEVRAYAQRLVSLAGGLAVVERQVRWFALWVSRYDEKFYEEGMEDINDIRVCERRIQYPAAFRMEVAAYAAKYSQMAAVRTFNVSRKRVFEWLRSWQDVSITEDDSHEASDPEIQRHGSGRVVTDSEVDQQVWQWYSDSQSQEQGKGRRPSSQEVRAYAAALYAKRGLSTQIQCSYGWFRRWCERFGVRLRYSTDDELLAWALAQLDCNHALCHADLQERARHLWRTQRPDFKASPGWAIRFCKRHPKLLQTVPSVTTPLPEPLRPSVTQFRTSLRDLVRTNALSPDAIGNMDELPLGFSAPLAGTPRRQLLLRKPGMDSCHATVVLCCLADGTLLPTMLILKDEVELAKPDSNVIVIQQDNGVMDLACMQKWLHFVWFRYAPNPNLLVADSFGPHCASEVTDAFAKGSSCKRLLKLIPAGCSSKLQPLDVSLKRTFQQYLDHCWERLNTGAGIGWACGQQLRLPSARELIQWVTNAHHYVMTSRQETIRRSFLVTGLLVADNHSEDHFIENPAALPPETEPPEFET